MGAVEDATPNLQKVEIWNLVDEKYRARATLTQVAKYEKKAERLNQTHGDY